MADLILVGIYRLCGRLFYFAEVLFYYTKLPIGINICKDNSKEKKSLLCKRSGRWWDLSGVNVFRAWGWCVVESCHWSARGAPAVPCVLALCGHPRNILEITEATFHTPNRGLVSGKLCGLQVFWSCPWTGLEGVCRTAKGTLLS